MAIDGPAGAGKSTIAKLVAQKLNFFYVDTGAMYRAVTLKALELGIDLKDETMYDFLDTTEIEFTLDHQVILDGTDVSKKIREAIVTQYVPVVASLKNVRNNLVLRQQQMSKEKSVIMDGRDIGTHVLKNADVKIFLTASVEERARRRHLELMQSSNENQMTFDDVKESILKRDEIDENREVNPLRMADDAIHVDSSNNTIEDVVNMLSEIILGRVNNTMNNNEIYDFKKHRRGEIIEGTVLRVTDNEVIVDFNYITEGTIYLNNLTLKDVSSAKEVVAVGDSIRAQINKIDEEQILLSRIAIELEDNLNELKKAYKKHEFVQAKVTKDLKNVLIIKANGVEGIMPKSEVDVDETFDAASLLGEEVTVKIMEVGRDKRRNRTRLVVSRKAVQLKDLYEKRVETFATLEIGESYEGEVVRVEDYGVLVVANDYQGLVPYREISHTPFGSITDVLNVGDKVNVKLIDKNEEKLQVLYSIKDLLLKPWELLEQEVNVGDELEGTIVRITDFGAFINVAPYIDGLLHFSEYSHNPNVNMFNEIEEQQKITVKVISLDANRERLGLSVKALKDNPWETVEINRFDIVKVKVTDFKDGDAIVEYTEDLQGILPKNQVSAEKRITSASDELTVGQEIDVKVTDFDSRNKRFVVSIRRISEDAERQEFNKYMKQQNEQKKDTLGDILGEQLKEVLKRK